MRVHEPDTERTDFHPGLEPIAFLLGTWLGSGNGRLHDGEPFPYEEEVRFTHRGRPWLVYEQRAWSPQDDVLLHTEMGFWRPDGDDHAVVWAFVSLTAGSDMSLGTVEGTTISFEATHSPMVEGIEPVVGLRRVYEVQGDTLTYAVQMTNEVHSPERHVSGTLRRAVPRQRSAAARPGR